VIGVIGPVNTQCAERMLPALSPASVALVSPTNSMPATVRGRSWPGYARLYPSDDYVTAAGAIAASRLGASVFFVEDREYSATLGTRVWFERAADRIGLRIAGRARFSVDSREYRRLARRVRASGASVVYINTVSTSHIGPLLRDLRAVLGSDVPFVGEYGLLPAANLWREAGDVARGVHVVSHAMGIDDLGQSSRDFIEAFGATQPNGHVSTVALYAAVAAEVLLDAIAHSDGTRASVVRALGEREFATLIGRVAFRPNGEPDRALVELVRVESGKGEPAEFSSVEGTAREPRIEVSRSLVE
jgi:branched-chain amino acid transport system substrate-binding protein